MYDAERFRFHLSTKSFEEHSSLKTHGGRHCQDELIPFSSSYHGKSDSSVA